MLHRLFLRASTCLVFGATSFIGSHLVDRLVSRGTRVVAVDGLESGGVERLEPGLRSGRVLLVYTRAANAATVADVVREKLGRHKVTAVFDVREQVSTSSAELAAQVALYLESVCVIGTEMDRFPTSSLIGEVSIASFVDCYGPFMSAASPLARCIATGALQAEDEPQAQIFRPLHISAAIEMLIGMMSIAPTLFHTVLAGPVRLSAQEVSASAARSISLPMSKAARIGGYPHGLAETVAWLREAREAIA